LQEKLKLLQVKYYYNEGDKAYAAGGPENILEAIEILERQIQALDKLESDSEKQDLSQKLRWLQIKRHNNVVQEAESAINRVNTRRNFDEEAVFQHYLKIDEAYLSLSELEPENEQWIENRRKKLKEQAELRQTLAHKAKRKHNYEAALRHYRAILDIEQTKKYEDLTQVLNLDLSKEIDELERKADYELRYREIGELIHNNEHLKALDKLVEDFISKGIYEHRDVAKLLWGLVYAKQNDGQFPPEWESVAELAMARNKLAGTEKQLDELQQKTTKVQNKLAESQNILPKLKRQHEINKYIIPISLVVAVIVGGVIAPQLETLSGLTAIKLIALALLAAYFGYYFWVYYISERLNE
jgi:hypothetical protein